MQDINDEKILEYVEKSAKGDEIAFEHLLAVYENNFKKKVKLYFLKGGDSQDLLQAMRCGLAKAVRLYEQSKGSFDYFVNICVKSELFDTIRLYNSKKQALLSACSDIDSEQAIDLASPIHDEVGDSELERLALELVETKYGKLDRDLFSLYLSDYSYDEIATKVGLTTKQVDNRLLKIKKYLEKRIAKEL